VNQFATRLVGNFKSLGTTVIGPLDNWTRFQNALHSATGTKNWHRHDLRRTAATIMHSMKVPASTIEQILAHVDPFRGENVGASASHYI
jgi:integrase